MKKNNYLRSFFNKLQQCHYNTIPIEYSIIIKLYLNTNLSLKKIIRFKKKNYSSSKIKFKNLVIDCKKILVDEECLFLEKSLKYLLKREYIFDSSKTRINLFYNIIIFIKSTLNIKKLQRGVQSSHPDIIVLGSPKSATTWFYNICKKFEFLDVGEKEPEFFSSINYCKGDGWYSSRYKRDNKLKLDVSVGYFDQNRALERISKYQQKYNLIFKFLIFVRKPSERIESYINYRKLTGRGWYNINRYLYSGHVYLKFIETSDYIKGMNKLEELFDKGQLFVVFHEDIVKNPKDVFLQILRFFNLEYHLKEVKNINSDFFSKKFNVGKKIILFPIYKFLFNLQRVIASNNKLKGKYSQLKSYLLFFLTKIVSKLIVESDLLSKKYLLSQKYNKIYEIDSKYKKLKKELTQKGIQFTKIDN